MLIRSRLPTLSGRKAASKIPPTVPHDQQIALAMIALMQRQAGANEVVARQ
jgi:hypothetical protein